MASKVKKGSKPKRVLSDLPARESESPPQPSFMSLVPSNPMVRGTVDGMPVWRQPSLKNEYNPEGITLAVIDHELADAKIVKEAKDWKVIEFWHGGSNCLGSDEERGVIIKFGFCKDINFSDIIHPEPLQYLKRELMLKSHQHLIEENDPYFAELIRESPEALIMLAGAQEAWARWSYASHWGKDHKTTAQAKKFMKACLPSRPGRRSRTPIDDKKLLRAYDDCCAYIRFLYNCAKALENVDKVLELFPEAVRLESFDVILSDITNPRKKGPAPSDVAAKYIAHSCGLSASRVMDLITEARNKTRARKTKPS